RALPLRRLDDEAVLRRHPLADGLRGRGEGGRCRGRGGRRRLGALPADLEQVRHHDVLTGYGQVVRVRELLDALDLRLVLLEERTERAEAEVDDPALQAEALQPALGLALADDRELHEVGDAARLEYAREDPEEVVE